MVHIARLCVLTLLVSCVLLVFELAHASVPIQEEDTVHGSVVRQNTVEASELLGNAVCDACTACTYGLTCFGAGLCVPSGDGASAAYRKCVDDGSVAYNEIAGRKLCDPCTRCKSYDLKCFAGICTDKLAVTETYLECIAAGSTPVGGVLPPDDPRITEERPQTSPLVGEEICDQCDTCRRQSLACWGAGLCVPARNPAHSRRLYRWCLKQGYQPLRTIVGTAKCEGCTTCSAAGMICFAGICVSRDNPVPEYKECIANRAMPVGGRLSRDDPRLNRVNSDGPLVIGREECDRCTDCRPGNKFWCWGEGLCVLRENPVEGYDACLAMRDSSMPTMGPTTTVTEMMQETQSTKTPPVC